MTTLPILCFNDVYRVSQKYVPQPGAPERRVSKGGKGSSNEEDKINVSQFGQLLHSHRDEWADSPEDIVGNSTTKEGLVLFAGDVFNPSVESSVTRGSHLVPIMNALGVDCACIGNHDFDFGFPHLTKLLESTNFPWLLSNIVDETTGTTPNPLRRFWTTERCGVRIGVIGLVEQDWIATIPSWPEHFTYRDMADTARTVSRELRDPDGEHRVEMIIALTHCRVPNDIKLCNELGALAGGQKSDEHGVDLVIGGHDHMYYIGKGASDNWAGSSGDHTAKGTEADTACHLIKSGTDFRDLTSATLTLSSSSDPKAIRKRTISKMTGEHLYVTPSLPSSPAIDELISTLLSSVSETLSKPVCFALTPFDARSELVRTKETGLGNWVADVLLHAYAESGIEGGSGFIEKEKKAANGDSADAKNGSERDDGGDKTPTSESLRDHGADIVLLCGGTLRGDSQYGPGKITLGDILEILPFEDPVVCIEVSFRCVLREVEADIKIDGKGLWEVLETSLSKWPAQEGRFPIVAGLAVQWDHLLPPNQRIKSIHLVKNPVGDEDDEIEHPGDMVNFVEQEDGTRVEVNQRGVELGEEVKRDGSRVYRVITREYMAQGYDGFEGLKNRKFIVDDENGQIMSSIIRSFLLGSAYIFRHKQLMDAHETHLSTRTDGVLSRARKAHQSPESSMASSPTSTMSGWGGRESKAGRSMSMSVPSPLGESPVNGMSGSLASLPAKPDGAGPGWGTIRRHVVKHDWRSIRDALFVGRNEHMSDVDDCRGDELRAQGSAILPKPIVTETGAVFIKKSSEDELKRLGGELAIVCPLIDGRMRDVSEGK